MYGVERENTYETLFVGFEIPAEIKKAMKKQINEFPDYLLRAPIAEEYWHVPLFRIGEVMNHKRYLKRLAEPLIQAHVPTLTFERVGILPGTDRLLGYFKCTPGLQVLRDNIKMRITRYRVPFEARVGVLRPDVHLSSKVHSFAQTVDTKSVTMTRTVSDVKIFKETNEGDKVSHVVECSIPLVP